MEFRFLPCFISFLLSSMKSGSRTPPSMCLIEKKLCPHFFGIIIKLRVSKG